MRPIQRVLCPVDFTALSAREISLAAALAERFGGELILQHNLSVGAALGVSWMHEKEHHKQDEAQQSEARQKMKELLDSVPSSVRDRTRGALTYGALDHCVQNMAEQAQVDLIVIGTHAYHEAGQASETERLIRHAPCPVLTTHDDAPAEWLPSLGNGSAQIPTLVPIDFSAHAMAALEYALELAERLPLAITALYVATQHGHDERWAEARLVQTIARERREKVKLEVREGKAAEEILAEEELLGTRLVIMGSHEWGLLERLLRRTASASLEMLRKSRCPVLYVPASARR